MDTNLQMIQKHLKKPVVLVGLMGAGKSKIGAMLADALDWPFVDADHEIEKAAGLSVAQIFEQHGEPAFRDLERQVIARLLSDELKVIAPGGGAVMNEQTAHIVWSRAFSIWMRADLDILVERTGRNSKRPLLKNGDPYEILGNMMKIRHPVYQKADLVIDSDEAPPEHTLEKLLGALAAHLHEQDNTAHG